MSMPFRKSGENQTSKPQEFPGIDSLLNRQFPLFVFMNSPLRQVINLDGTWISLCGDIPSFWVHKLLGQVCPNLWSPSLDSSAFIVIIQ